MNWVLQLVSYGLHRWRLKASPSYRMRIVGDALVQQMSADIEDYLNTPQGVCPRCYEDFYTYSVRPSYWIETTHTKSWSAARVLYTSTRGEWPLLGEGQTAVDAPNQYHWEFQPCGHTYVGEMRLTAAHEGDMAGVWIWQAVRR